MSYGAFFGLEGGCSGFVHISQVDTCVKYTCNFVCFFTTLFCANCCSTTVSQLHVVICGLLWVAFCRRGWVLISRSLGFRCLAFFSLGKQ